MTVKSPHFLPAAADAVRAGAACLFLALLSLFPARAAEVCRYAGQSSYSGRAAVQTEAAEAGSLLTVHVTARLDAKPWWFWSIQYLTEEISTWRGGELQSVAVNTRYSVGGTPKRQQWDVWTREPDGMAASRVQSKTLAEFQRRHPAFAGYWDPGRVAQPGLPDYAAARPERRPDLVLLRAAMPPGTRTPLALAFYWSRWLPAHGETIPVFMPGWKRDKRLDAVAAPFGAAGRWRVTLRYPGWAGAVPSTAEATVSGDHRLLRLLFDVHGPAGDGKGWMDGTGCKGR